MKTRDQLIKELKAMSERTAYNPKLKPGDRDTIEETITYLSMEPLKDFLENRETNESQPMPEGKQ